ncbi:hypothetical protein KY289_030723 [Solanum tuberosum]|nr:hypothetical protein KY289_030723 [Solanum tuberosum]
MVTIFAKGVVWGPRVYGGSTAITEGKSVDPLIRGSVVTFAEGGVCTLHVRM